MCDEWTLIMYMFVWFCIYLFMFETISGPVGEVEGTKRTSGEVL